MDDKKLVSLDIFGLFEWTIRLTYDQRWTSNGKDYKPHFEPCTTCCGHDVEFVHRYHPNNQYQVTTLYEGKKEQHRCFWRKQN